MVLLRFQRVRNLIAFMALAGYTTIDATGPGYPMPDHKLVYDWLVGKASWPRLQRVSSLHHDHETLGRSAQSLTKTISDRSISIGKTIVESGDLTRNVIFVEPNLCRRFPQARKFLVINNWPCGIKAGETFHEARI